VLPGGAFREVTLEIFDDKGARVRRYSSADAPPAIDPAKLRTAPEWFVTPSTLSTAPGMHRFVWPLRFAAPTALTNGRGIYADGVWAPPGNYKVALSVDGRKLVQPLTIVPDPRVNLPASAYEEQVALATQVVDTWAGVDGALDEADTLIKTLAERRKSSSGAAATAIDALRARAIELSDIVPAKNPVNVWWLAPKRTNSLRFLDGALERLATAVDGADAAPTPDARAGYAKLRPAAEAAVREWTAFKAKELAELNERLKAMGQAVITVP